MSAPNPSLCIPRVFDNITENRVADVFNQLNLGKLSRIDIVQRKNERGDTYKRVFIHFDYWFNTLDATAAKCKILDGKELKIVYDGPWFWKVSLSKYNSVPHPAATFKPHIEWADTEPFMPAASASVPIAPQLPVAPKHLPPHPPAHVNQRQNKTSIAQQPAVLAPKARVLTKKNKNDTKGKKYTKGKKEQDRKLDETK